MGFKPKLMRPELPGNVLTHYATYTKVFVGKKLSLWILISIIFKNSTPNTDDIKS